MKDWRCIGASVAGSRHVREGVPCEDALSVSAGNGFLIAVIADGAGSAPRGGEGADLLVRTAVAQARHIFAEGLPKDAVELRTALYRLLARTRKEMESLVADHEAFGHYASTVAVVVGDADRFGAIQVGDGAVVVLRGSGTLEQVAAPAQPEFVNQTTFLTSSYWRDWVACHVEDGSAVGGFALITDGLVPLATIRPSGVPHEPFFDPLFDFVGSEESDEETLSAFLRSDRVRTASDDDITLLVATRESP